MSTTAETALDPRRVCAYVVSLARLFEACTPVRLPYEDVQREILGFTWGQVDLTVGCIRLKEGDTKISEARSIPIRRELRQVLQSLPLAIDSQGNHLPYMFTRNGQRIKSIREIFSRVCRDAGLTNVVFHDQRHTATTTLRRAGVDALTAMKITGHKTMAVC